MMRIIKSLVGSVAVWLLARYRGLSLDLIRIRATAFYVKGVRAARSAYLGLLALLFAVVLAGAGFVLFHVGLFVLLPKPWNGIVLMALGAIYMLAALLGLRATVSEKTWMRLSQADRLVAEATGKPDV